MGRTTAHAGRPASGQQSHHKLPTLDPLVARNEVLARQADPVALAQALTGVAPTPAPTATAQFAPRRQLSRLLKGAAKTIGIRPGKPLPREELLRYADTPLKPGGPAAAPEVPEDPRRTISALTTLLGSEQEALNARVAVDQAAAAQAQVTGHLDRTEGDLALSVRRVGGLGDRIEALTRQSVDTIAEIATVRDAIESTRGVIASTRQLLARLREAHACTQHALDAFVEARPPRSGGMPQRASRSLRELMRCEDERLQQEDRLAGLAMNVALLEDIENQESESLASLEAEARALEQRRQGVESRIRQARHSADLNQRALWEHSDAAESLRASRGPLQQVEQERRALRAPAESASHQAFEAYVQTDSAVCCALLETCACFAAAAERPVLRKAMQAWSDTLDERLLCFGIEALPKSLALEIAFQALGIATCADARRAAALVDELQETPLAALVPPASLGRPLPAPSKAACTLAQVLAEQPSGIQILELLLAPSPAVLGQTQAQAARVYLTAEDAQRKLAGDDSAQRHWIASAQTAARHVLHAADSTGALVACTEEERAAYRAFCNGYYSNAPGSPYDKANRHLKKLARWLGDRAAARCASLGASANPLDALREGMVVGAANGLPTPSRQAAKALEEAAAHLEAYLAARRQLMPPGWTPSPGELAWQAIAHHVQWRSEDIDLTTMKLDDKAVRTITRRSRELRRRFEQAACGPLEATMASNLHPALDTAWRVLRNGTFSVPEAFGMLHDRMSKMGSPSPCNEASMPNHIHWRNQEEVLRARLQGAVTRANRLLHDGDPARVVSARTLFDFSRDMLENLEWRDRLRLIGQKAWGLNTGPVSAALAAASLPTGVGVKLLAGVQQNREELLEIYMGRTGLYLQLGEQATRQFQAGIGANLGYLWGVGDAEEGVRAGLGLGGTADWRMKREAGIESGVQLRVLRFSKGKEPELLAQFMDMYEHLLTLAARHGGGGPDDWMQELLAHHSNLNIGLIDNAVRESKGTESNASLFAGLRAGNVDDRPRRVNLSVSVGVKAKRDQGRTQTEVAGYMTTLYRDSTAQAKVDANARAAAGLLLHQWSEHEERTGALRPKAYLGTAMLDLAHAAEIRVEGATRFSTLFTIDKKIDTVRSDCAMDFQDFAAFEREVRREWNAWVHYGTAKVPDTLDEGMRYAIAERQLEHLLDQGRLFAKQNKFATAFVDKVLKPKAAPALDGLRTLASLERKAHREQKALQTERLFDDFVAQPAVWEPTLLLIREKPRMQVERGIDFLVKYQNNRIAEAMRTVGQWPLYEWVPRAAQGSSPKPLRQWRQDGGPADAEDIRGG
ncbi:hypothetical protein NBM50_01715 [Xylophilus ampelinus]|uniref:Uncharacterized protein n=2 Tax=Xylophilus ampelinus TaxID=54067 RepID=A0A318SKK4_9BURK|nr:hypothetical protein [Xylophilus ampelinus]PYE79554.1 hypothetical protein DFQ15_102289 [Xylophilus ampelinus]